MISEVLAHGIDCIRGVLMKENRNIEIYYLEERHKLFETFRSSIELSSHYALKNLRDRGEFVLLKMNKPFHFLLQEHDEKVRPILIVE